MKNNRVVLIDMKRSAFARGGKGMLVNTRLDKLSVHILQALLEKNKQIKIEDISEFGLGQVLHADELLNMGSAQIAQLAGLPYEMNKFELNRQCGSSMDVIHRMTQAIMLDTYDVGIAMGVERMQKNLHLFNAKTTPITSLNPELFRHHSEVQKTSGKRHNQYFSHPIPTYILQAPALCTMTQTAQNVADWYEITREECDEFALNSHKKYKVAKEKGIYHDEIVPVEIAKPVFLEDGGIDYKNKNEIVIWDSDEGFRPTTTMESLKELNVLKGVQSYNKRPIVLTAGNCCPTNDGVSAALLTSLDYAKENAIEPLAEIIGIGCGGIKPQVMGVGPVIAIQKALKHANLTMEEIDYIEFNEAFASQVLATMKELKYPLDKVNVNGGSLAIGHPLGATGVRLVGTLAKQLQRTGKRYGIAAQCIGAGMGIATVIKNPKV